NWRSSCDRRQEIDLVCGKDGVLVFVEVRARSEDALVRGFDSLGSRKMKSLRRSFKAYLREASFNPRHYRFDVIEVDLPSTKGNKPKVFHHENVAIFA
ncbi:MAG: YraN family protein, partial [Opitutae bacterium]